MHQSFNQRVHFYYCILVALKIHVKKRKKIGRSEREKNNFLLKWLRKAQDNNIFFTRISPAKSNGYAEKNYPCRS